MLYCDGFEVTQERTDWRKVEKNLKKRLSLSPLSSPTSLSPTSISLRSTTTRFSRSSALAIFMNYSSFRRAFLIT